jgi:hypothetical protein
VFLAVRGSGRPERDALTYAVRAAASCAADHGVTGPRLTADLDAIRREVRRAS